LVSIEYANNENACSPNPTTRRFGSILFRSCAADQNFGINGSTKM